MSYYDKARGSLSSRWQFCWSLKSISKIRWRSYS